MPQPWGNWSRVDLSLGDLVSYHSHLCIALSVSRHREGGRDGDGFGVYEMLRC